MIPAMTDPLGRYWRQPADIRDAPMDAETVLLTSRQLDDLAEYSSSMPSGAYEGKCWKRDNGFGSSEAQWWLGWYGPCSEPGFVSNNWRRIEVVT